MRVISSGRGAQAQRGLRIDSGEVVAKPLGVQKTDAVEVVSPEPAALGAESGAKEEVAVQTVDAATPTEVEPVLNTLADGEYKVRGGWNLTVAGSSIRIEVASTASHAPGRLSAGNLILNNGPSQLIIAFGTATPAAAGDNLEVAEASEASNGPAAADAGMTEQTSSEEQR